LWQVFLSTQPETPFDNLESAHEYIHLLIEAIAEARNELKTDIATAEAKPDRRLEALRLVEYKLEKLESHLQSSGRILNDLRTLRRLLFEERTAAVAKRTGTEG
jgi:chromosome segregation ATPase